MRRLVFATMPFLAALVLVGCGSGDSEDVIAKKQVILKVPGMT